jgi:hypothetical protein
MPLRLTTSESQKAADGPQVAAKMLPGASSGRQSGGWGQEMSRDAPKSGGGSPPIDPQMAVQGTKASPHVFISYASQDAAVAQRLCATLEAAGFPCWIAPRDVEAGALYADAIVRAINEAKAVVLVLSASAIASDHVATNRSLRFELMPRRSIRGLSIFCRIRSGSMYQRSGCRRR